MGGNERKGGDLGSALLCTVREERLVKRGGEPQTLVPNRVVSPQGRCDRDVTATTQPHRQ